MHHKTEQKLKLHNFQEKKKSTVLGELGRCFVWDPESQQKKKLKEQKPYTWGYVTLKYLYIVKKATNTAKIQTTQHKKGLQTRIMT